jgi:ribonuclease-3
MCITQARRLSTAVEGLAQAFQAVLTISPELQDIDFESPNVELDDEVLTLLRQPPLRIARAIKSAYEKGEADMVDIIMSNYWGNSTGVVTDFKFVSSSPSLEAVVNRSLKAWPPSLPRINDDDLEIRVFTHKSAVSKLYPDIPEEDSLSRHNEQLTFIGYHVLTVIVSNIIVETFSDMDDKDLDAIQSRIVGQDSLVNWAAMYGLDEKLQDTFDLVPEYRAPLIAEMMKAYIGGLYLDVSTRPAELREWISDLIKPIINEYNTAAMGEAELDKEAKNQLARDIAGSGVNLDYVTVILGDGVIPFAVECRLGNEVVGVGTGPDKEAASLRAAMMALGNTRAVYKYSQKGKRAANNQPKNNTTAWRGAKSELYTMIGSPQLRPVYRTVAVSGAFHSTVCMSGECLGDGRGKSKMDAEQAAAAEALKNPRLSKYVIIM